MVLIWAKHDGISIEPSFQSLNCGTRVAIVETVECLDTLSDFKVSKHDKISGLNLFRM